MPASRSVQSTARKLPCSSATMASSPIGVAMRSMRSESGSAMKRLLDDRPRCGVGSPKMLRGIGAPGAPWLGAAVELGGAGAGAGAPGGAAQQADIAGRKGVGLAHGTERDVMRRPFADAANVAQPRDRVLDGGERLEEMGIRQSRLGEREEGGLARAGHAEGGKIGRRDLGGARKGAGEGGIAALLDRYRRAAQLHELAGETPTGLDRDLLTQHGAHRQLEAVPAARRAQAGPFRDQRRQQRILRQMRADRRDIGAKIEDPAD